MKLKNYKELFEEIDPKDWGEDDDDLYGRPNYSRKSIHSGYDPDAEDDVQDDDMQHLLYLIRSLFKNGGVDADIDHEGLNISICVVLNRKEKMSNILRVFDVAKKLKKDILLQYESEFELWETKDDRPVLTFNFEYTDGVIYDKDDDEDDDEDDFEEEGGSKKDDIPF